MGVAGLKKQLCLLCTPATAKCSTSTSVVRVAALRTTKHTDLQLTETGSTEKDRQRHVHGQCTVALTLC